MSTFSSEICTNLAKVCFVICLCLHVYLADGLKLQIFRDLRHRGLIYESPDIILDCQNVESYGRGRAGSVRTNGCVIVYEQLDCKGRSVKIAPDMTDLLERLNKDISSYRVCNATYGGSKISVDVFGNNDLIARYRDICGCQDLPTQVSNTVTRIDNYGNCVTVYSTDTCSGTSKEIPGGINEDSDSLGELPYFVRSISACGNRKACMRFDAKVFKFSLLFDDSKAAVMASDRKVEMAAKTTFYNNGSATVTQEYHASKTVRQSFTMMRSTTLTKMDSCTTEAGLTTEVSAGYEGFGVSVSASVSASLTEAYTVEKSEENTEEESYTTEEEKTFAVTQTIEIPPCAAYEVSSLVTIRENYPVVYEVFAKVSGTSSGLPMSAQEISTKFDDMTFVEIYDDHTAIFKSQHRLVANVGVDTTITGEGYDIEGCKTPDNLLRRKNYKRLSQ